MDDFLTVKITSPEKIIWEGRANAISSENTDGPFDILPEHANFITLIKDHPIVVHRSDGKREFTFERAVIYIKDNEVTVYANLGANAAVVYGDSDEMVDDGTPEDTSTKER